MARGKNVDPRASQGPSSAHQEPCRHQHLATTCGGLYLQCCDCPRKFGALLSGFDILDIMARGERIPEGSHRSDPFATACKKHR